MPQRSFRVSDECLDDLNRIAEHLAQLDHHAPNQTRALAWAVARGIDAIEQGEKQAKAIPAGIDDQIRRAAELLRGLSERWREAAQQSTWARSRREEEQRQQESELKQLREQVVALEADLGRARAKPYREPGKPSEPTPEAPPPGARTIKVRKAEETRLVRAVAYPGESKPLFTLPGDTKPR